MLVNKTYRDCSDDKANRDFFIVSEVVRTLIECGFVIIDVNQFNFYESEV